MNEGQQNTIQQRQPTQPTPHSIHHQQQPQQPQQQRAGPHAPMSNGMSLQQVINIVDNRLTALEKKTTENQKDQEYMTMYGEYCDKINEIIDEYDKRFELLVEEIGNLKEIILGLQSYTMGVNKRLVEVALDNGAFSCTKPTVQTDIQENEQSTAPATTEEINENNTATTNNDEPSTTETANDQQ